MHYFALLNALTLRVRVGFASGRGFRGKNRNEKCPKPLKGLKKSTKTKEQHSNGRSKSPPEGDLGAGLSSMLLHFVLRVVGFAEPFGFRASQ